MKKNSYLLLEKNKGNITIKLDIPNKELNSEIVKSDMKLLFKLSKLKKKIDIVTNLELNEENAKNNEMYNLIVALKACNIRDKNQRLEYIYDAACKYLDNQFIKNNICGFCDDICDEKRPYGIKDGCCRKFSSRYFGLFMKNKFVPCEYHVGKVCTANCLGCKLFCCSTVIKKGFNFTTYNVPIIRYYFNFIQKVLIRQQVFKPKEKVLSILRIFSF